MLNRSHPTRRPEPSGAREVQPDDDVQPRPPDHLDVDVVYRIVSVVLVVAAGVR
ncbi:MAG: hypothetical protein FWD11_11480 [Micrococcales bacterium]|nr:hypothetical protein [Micrococcales bacterium]